MKSVGTIVAVLLSLTLLSGCQTLAGQGPLDLDPKVAAEIEVAMAQARPIDTIAVSTDGRHLSITYCKTARCWGNPVELAIGRCQEQSGGVPCYLYARGRNLVWDFGPDAGEPARWQTGRLTIDKGRVALDLELDWQEDPDRAALRLLGSTPEFRDCSGHVQRVPVHDRVDWQFSCASGQAFSGKLKPANRKVLIGPGYTGNRGMAILSLR